MDCTEESQMWWMVVGRDECESLGFELTWEKKTRLSMMQSLIHICEMGV